MEERRPNIFSEGLMLKYMTSRDFCYWLQGFFELTIDDGDISVSKEQAKMIRNHLNLVFKHEIDPSMPDPTGELQAIHDGKIKPHPFNKPNPFSGEQLIRC